MTLDGSAPRCVPAEQYLLQVMAARLRADEGQDFIWRF